jgi:diguanylate cyclase (GGDEF)-like protein
MRSSVSRRVVLSLCATAAISALLAVLLQSRTLSRDLEETAGARLDQAAGAALSLLEQHQKSVRERHRAIARTPEFRANLETAHAPTLAKFASGLREHTPDTRAVLFTNRRGDRVAAAGDAALVTALYDRAALEPAPDCGAAGRAQDCDRVTDDGRSLLIALGGELHVATSVSLFTRAEYVGHLVMAEVLPPERLRSWASLAGARLVLHPAGSPSETLERVAVEVGDTELRVVGSFEAERRALAHLHASALTAGAAALAFAFACAVPLSRGLVRPIRMIEGAAHRIRSGDWSSRLRSKRRDELGDVARAFDMMLDHIEESQASLQRAQRIGRLGGWSRIVGASDVIVSQELCRLLDLDPDLDASTDSVSFDAFLERVHPDDRAYVAATIECCESEGLPFSIDHRVVLDDRSERTVHTQGERSIDPGGRQRVEGTVQDITERKEIEEEVRRLAYKDGLTGLGNRRLFGESLQRAIEIGRQQLAPLAVLFLDLDDFKIVNDTLGHSAGDRLLRTVADRIADVVVELGTPDAPASVHRLGGDEFAVLLPRLAAGDAPLDYAKRILESLARSVDLDGYDVRVSASVGIARWPDEGEHAEALLQSCDTAMYHAKRQGRGLYRVYDASMRESVERQLQIESRLSRAIELGHLRVYYQPKVDTQSGRVRGLEALLRWNDPELGIVRPDEFIPLAESTGQILELGRWVLREAALQASRWLEEGTIRVPVAVNVSSSQIVAGVLVESVAEVLRETGLPPGQLELEVTESAVLPDEGQAIELMQEVKRLGVALSLDDFGTGYSSLSYLRRLPIDSVKIDRSFVVGIADNESDYALLGSIVAMTKVLGLEVVAEGVETEAQHVLLAEMGCNLGQGYWYSEPVPADQVLLAIEQCESSAKRWRE